MRSFNGMAGAGVRRVGSAILGLALLAACDVPEAPEWEVGLTVPFSSDPITIVDFLPAGVDTAVIGGRSFFTVIEQGDSSTYSLGEICGPCAALQSATTDVPGFDFVDSLDVRFAPELVAIELFDGRLGARFHNQMSFDPLRPHPDPDSAGYVAFAIRDLLSGVLLDSLFISGTTESLPPGSTREFAFAVTNAVITQGVRAVFYVHSPADGQTAQIDTAASAGIAAFLDQLLVDAVSAVVDADTLEENFLIEFEDDARSEIAERVQSAIYELELIHSGEVDGTLEISIAESAAALFSGDPLSEVRLTGLAFTPSLVQSGELTPDEVQRIADFLDVHLGYRGVASGTRTGPGGIGNVSRFTADELLRTEFRVTSRIRVGG